MTPEQHLAIARALAVRSQPYFVSIIRALVPVPQVGLRTFSVSKDLVLRYDPELFNEDGFDEDGQRIPPWTAQQAAGVILHEIQHPLRKHYARCDKNQADPSLWNIAADCEINDDLVAAGVTLPDGAYVPRSINCADGQLAEFYYEELAKNKKPPQAKPKACCGGCGSGAGNPSPGEGDGEQGDDSDENGGASAQHNDTGGRSAQEVEAIRHECAVSVEEHASRGSVPAGFARWAKATREPAKVDWRSQLARLIRAKIAEVVGQQIATFTRISRLQSSYDRARGAPRAPAYAAPRPKVALVVDTSGSMGSRELENALRECEAVLKVVGAPVEFVVCDAAVHTDTTVRSIRDVMNGLKGGGGTDFRPAFDALDARKRNRPNVVVFITDGCGPFPAAQPRGMHTIFALIGRHVEMPPWGAIVRVD